MEVPAQITFRRIEPSAAVEADVRDKIAKLEQFYDGITSCRVMIEPSQRRHHKGNLYHIRVDLRVPGSELVVKRDPAEHASHEDIYVAVRDAFDSARRELQSYVRKRRRKVKHHEAPPHARVVRLLPDEGYGFLESVEGIEVYFHRNSVLGDAFDDLQVGTEVRFAEESGDKGPQASTVEIVGKGGGAA